MQEIMKLSSVRKFQSRALSEALKGPISTEMGDYTTRGGHLFLDVWLNSIDNNNHICLPQPDFLMKFENKPSRLNTMSVAIKLLKCTKWRDKTPSHIHCIHKQRIRGERIVGGWGVQHREPGDANLWLLLSHKNRINWLNLVTLRFFWFSDELWKQAHKAR